MKCPVCEDSRMREVEKNGIMIDLCPTCKGVWLDRGELDKLMSEVRGVREEYNEWHNRGRDEDEDKRRTSSDSRPVYNQNPSEPYRGSKDSDDHYNRAPYKKKKKSVLDVFGDLFE